MANILKQSLKYKRRTISSDGTGYATFSLASAPSYNPEVGQTVLVSHTDAPASSGIAAKITAAQTNVFTAKFVNKYTDTSASVAKDGYTEFYVLQYTDVALANAPGSTCGTIEFEASPAAYTVMKKVENSQVVQEQQFFNGTDGKSALTLHKVGAGTSTNIAPMLIVKRDVTNSPFSNLYKAFNLPVTSDQIAEFRQTPLGYLTQNNNGSVIVGGVKYDWTESLTTGTVIHPTNGYTGTYYGTAYAGLCPIYNDANFNDILVIEIPHEKYGEIIDGKSIKLMLPKDTTSLDSSAGYYSIYSAYQENLDLFDGSGLDSFLSERNLLASAFGAEPQLVDGETSLNTNYQSNIALLFCDDIKKPNGDSSKSWSTGHEELMAGNKVYNSNAAVIKERFNLANDICVGIAYLDKGFAVITNPLIVSAIENNFKAAGKVYYGDLAFTGYNEHPEARLITTIGDNDNTQFMLSGATLTTCEFISYNTEKSLNIICLASTDEFYRTTNPTARELVGTLASSDVADLKDTNTLFPVIITELGLHDADGNLLAICKPTVPIKKYWYDVVAFNVRIRL